MTASISQLDEVTGPHQNQPVLVAGQPLDQARAVVILLHGRGATATDILRLAEVVGHGAEAYLAPQAKGNTWYPNSFLQPIASNEPKLSSAMSIVGSVLAHVVAAGIPTERTVLLGFSQGACLALEFAARNPRRYGGVVGFSGGLIGPNLTPRDYGGSLAGTPVFLGCSDVDPHIPKERVEESADIFGRLGGNVTLRLYPGLGHTIVADEIAFASDLLAGFRDG